MTASPSTHPTVLVTVTGNLDTASMAAGTTSTLAELLPEWAARCSSHQPSDLVVVSEDHTALYDPGDTLADLGAGYGTVLRVVTAEEAMDVLDVATATPADDPVIAFDDPASSLGSPAAAGDDTVNVVSTDRDGDHPIVVAVPPSPLPPAPQRPTGSSQHPQPVSPTTDPRPAATQGGEPSLPPRVPTTQRFSRALRAVLSGNSGPAPQVAAFGKTAAPPKAGERYRRAMQATDRAHNLEVMIRQATLPACAVIAVVSPKGGAGKTTITALLGSLFAELRRDPVLALDANPDFGNLKDKLGPPGQPAATTDELFSWLQHTPAATPAELAARLGAGPHGLRYLPTPVGDLERMVSTADFALYRNLIARLRDYQGIIVVDCGTGLLDPPVRAALETADQIVLVTDSSADTAGLVVTAAHHLPTGTPTWLVANKMPERGAMVDLDRVAEAIPALRGVTVVPEKRLTENVVTPAFDWAQAPAGWREPLREIGARLAAHWASLA